MKINAGAGSIYKIYDYNHETTVKCTTTTLVYQLAVSVFTISTVFYHLIVEMDSRLFRFVYWPNRYQLWTTKPQCFQYTSEKKTTVIIDCFEVFIETGYRLPQATNTASLSRYSSMDNPTGNYFFCFRILGRLCLR